MGTLVRAVRDLKDEEIQAYARLLNKEDDVLASLGCNARQAENVKKTKRWRKFWDKGYAQGMVDKNREMYTSKDPSVLKLYSDKVVPQTEAVEETIEVKAPKWFYEELKVDKLKKARRDA